MSKNFGKATDLIDFSRSSGGTALRKIAYGPELVTNGTFDSDATGTTPATWEANSANASLIKQADGTALFSSTSFGYVRLQNASRPVLPVGVYEVSFSISEWSAGLLNVHVGLGTGGNVVTGNGSYSYMFESTAEQAYEFQLRPNSGGTGSFKIDNISVREIPVLKWAPHNLLTYSEDFSNAAWNIAQAGITVVSNVVEAPDGNLTADKLEETATTDHHRKGAVASESGTNRRFSFYAKAAERQFARCWSFGGGNTSAAPFDLLNGTVGSNSLNATIEDVGNGWYKCEVDVDKPHSTVVVGPSNSLSTGTNTYAGTAGSGIYIWGAHAYRSDLGGMVDNPERGDSYVPTTSSAVYLPRIGHHEFNGYEWVNKGLLAESESRTNLITYSEDFTDASWLTGGLSSATSSNTAVSPDGTLNADTISDDGLGGTVTLIGVAQTVTVSTSTAYTASVFAKAAGSNFLSIAVVSLTTPANGKVWFDLVNGTVGTSNAGLSGSIEDFGSGWYRCSITFTTDAADTSGQIRFYLDNADGGSTITRDGTNSIYLYGAQFEAGSVPSSYVPTSGATATRAAETFTVPAANLPWPQPEYAVSEFGPELITNGTFDVDSGWTKGANATIANGALNFNYTSFAGMASQPVSLTANKAYVVSYEVTEYTSGGLRFYFDAYLPTATAVGTYSRIYVPSSNVTNLSLQGTGEGFVGSLDNVSVRELTSELVLNGGFAADSDWIKGTGWTISGGVASCDGTQTAPSTIGQTVTVEAGKMYIWRADVTAITSGNLSLSYANGTGFVVPSPYIAYTSTGQMERTFVASTSGTVVFNITAAASSIGSVDNATLREINPLSVSIAMKGEMDYADESTTQNVMLAQWFIDSNNRIYWPISTATTFTGRFQPHQANAGTYDNVSTGDVFSPGLNVPFDVASRHGSTFINGAVDGVALTANTTPTALPDLSATDLDLAYDFMGTIESFRVWDQDLGDSGIEEASAPSLEPSLNLTFDGSGLSFTDTGWTP